MNKINKLAVKAQLGLNRIKENITNERGEAVTWIVLVIVCIIVVVAAYAKFKSAPGAIGTSITNMGTDAANGLDGVRVGP